MKVCLLNKWHTSYIYFMLVITEGRPNVSEVPGMIRWLNQNEGALLKIFSVIFLGFGTGLFLVSEYVQALESGLIGILIYGIYRFGSKFEKHLDDNNDPN